MDMECITSQPLEEKKMNKKTKGKKREKGGGGNLKNISNRKHKTRW